MEEKLRVLILEDLPTDAELMLYQLKSIDIAITSKRVETEESFSEALELFNPDLILSDYNLPGFLGLDALEIAKVAAPQTPFIIVSGALGEEQAIEALKSGATDYVLKQRLERLAMVVTRALKEKEEIIRRTQAEKDLKESESRYRKMYNKTPAMMHTIDKHDNLIFVSDYWLEVLGYEREEVLGQKSCKLLTEQSANELVKDVFPAAMEAGTVKNKRFQVVKKSGEIIDIILSATAERNEKGEIISWLVVVTDISDRIRAEEELKENKERLELVIQGAELALWDWNIAQGKVTYNQRWADMLGYDLSDIDQNFKLSNRFIHPDDIHLMARNLEDHLNGNTPYYENEHRVLTKSGNWKWVLDKGKVIEFDKNGNPLRASGTHLDITQRKKSEEALIEGQNMERKRVAREIHDGIGQMLIAMKYQINGLTDKLPLEENERLNSIQELIDYTISEARVICNNLTSVFLDKYGLEKALHQLCGQAEKITDIKIKLDVNLAESIHKSEAMKTVYRITQEAVNNIVKYSMAKTAEVNIRQNRESFKLYIEDNGQGFDLNKMSAGNGVRNMRERTELLKGSFDIDSSPGNGTKINVTIPH